MAFKIAKIRFRSGLCPGPRWKSSRRSPDPLVGWRGDTPPQAHTPPHSAPTHLRRLSFVTQNSSQLINLSHFLISDCLYATDILSVYGQAHSYFLK